MGALQALALSFILLIFAWGNWLAFQAMSTALKLHVYFSSAKQLYSRHRFVDLRGYYNVL